MQLPHGGTATGKLQRNNLFIETSLLSAKPLMAFDRPGAAEHGAEIARDVLRAVNVEIARNQEPARRPVWMAAERSDDRIMIVIHELAVPAAAEGGVAGKESVDRLNQVAQWGLPVHAGLGWRRMKPILRGVPQSTP